MKKNCITCNKEYSVKPYEFEKRKYCSFKCYYPHRLGVIPGNKGKKYTIPKARTGKTIKCKTCGKEKYFERNQLIRRPCKWCSVYCARQQQFPGEKPRKEKIVYSSIHSRIKRDWGKGKQCEHCKSQKNIDWANISGNYLLVREDWKTLCRKCHIAFDKANGLLAYKNFIKR